MYELKFLLKVIEIATKFHLIIDVFVIFLFINIFQEKTLKKLLHGISETAPYQKLTELQNTAKS